MSQWEVEFEWVLIHGIWTETALMWSWNGEWKSCVVLKTGEWGSKMCGGLDAGDDSLDSGSTQSDAIESQWEVELEQVSIHGIWMQTALIWNWNGEWKSCLVMEKGEWGSKMWGGLDAGSLDAGDSLDIRLTQSDTIESVNSSLGSQFVVVQSEAIPDASPDASPDAGKPLGHSGTSDDDRKLRDRETSSCFGQRFSAA